VAIERQAHRASVEQIQEAYAHLSLAQIYAALAYYYDHQEQVDAEIAEAARYAEGARAQNPNLLNRQQLEARLRTGEDGSAP
jgi:pyrroloquinoline quinone (PQQ) biosynthesis protein C